MAGSSASARRKSLRCAARAWCKGSPRTAASPPGSAAMPPVSSTSGRERAGRDSQKDMAETQEILKGGFAGRFRSGAIRPRQSGVLEALTNGFRPVDLTKEPGNYRIERIRREPFTL